MKKGLFVAEVVVTDPETGGLVEVEIYKHPNGAMFGVDSSYLDNNFDDDVCPVVPDLFADLPDDAFKYNDGDCAIELDSTDNLK